MASKYFIENASCFFLFNFFKIKFCFENKKNQAAGGLIYCCLVVEFRSISILRELPEEKDWKKKENKGNQRQNVRRQCQSESCFFLLILLKLNFARQRRAK